MKLIKDIEELKLLSLGQYKHYLKMVNKDASTDDKQKLIYKIKTEK